MKRTQIYLPEDTHAELSQWAKQHNTSIAELIRNFVKEGLKQKKTTQKSPDLIGLSKLGLKGGPKDLSANLEKYLYQ
jgi:triacylglycerol esterase/lipase EstA (alpha/beta hydrolase family)